jgi:hypothetical protein
MDDKIELLHARKAFGAARVVVVDDVEKLIDEIRVERKDRRVLPGSVRDSK